MNTILPPATNNDPRGALLIECVRRFYLQLLRSALWSIRRCRVLDPASSHEDLAQEAVLRLITRSPPGWRTNPPALRVLKSWVKRCARHLCVDMSRRADRRGPHAAPDWSEVQAPRSNLTPSQPPSPLDQLVAESQAATALSVLRATYARGAELLEHVLAQPDITNDEVAVLMGTSRPNVYQIRSRARAVLREARLGAASVDTLSL